MSGISSNLRFIDYIRERSNKNWDGKFQSKEFNPLNLSMADFFPMEMIKQYRPDLLIPPDGCYETSKLEITQRQWCKFAINLVDSIEYLYDQKFDSLKTKGILDKRLSFLGDEQREIVKFKMEFWFSSLLRMIKDQVSHWRDPNRPNMSLVDQVRMFAKSGLKMSQYVPEMEDVIWSMIFAANVCVGANSPQERIKFACATMGYCLDVVDEMNGSSATEVNAFYQECFMLIASMVRPENWDDSIIPVVQSYLTMIPDVAETPRKTSANCFERGMAPIVSYWIDFTTTSYDKIHASMLETAFHLAIKNTKSNINIQNDYYFHPGSWIVERLGDRIPIQCDKNAALSAKELPVEQLPRD